MIRFILALWVAALPLVASAQDLDGDTDHTGTIEGSILEERLEDTQPVIILNNCDDDDSDEVPDNADGAMNGLEDARDWEPVVVREFISKPKQGVTLRIKRGLFDRAGSAGVRILDRGGAEVIGPRAGAEYEFPREVLEQLARNDLVFHAEGLEFSAEANLELVVAGKVVDDLVLKTAPFLLLPHTQEAERNFVVETPLPDSAAYVQAFQAAAVSANVTPVVVDDLLDVWIEDEFQWGYTETPRVALPVVLHMHRQRELEDNVEQLLGPDVGYFKAFSYPADHNALDYGGNLEVSPPTPQFPFGRIYYGGTPSVNTRVDTFETREIHPQFRAFFQRQGLQPPINLTTDWLSVGHVDEVVTFLPDQASGSFAMVLASPKLGLEILQAMPDSTALDPRYTATYGLQTVGQLWYVTYLQRSFEDYNLDIDARIFGTDHANPAPDSIKGILKEALGIPEDRIYEVPVVYGNADVQDLVWASTAGSTGMVNLSSMGDIVLAPDPFIPEFKAAAEDVFSSLGLTAQWIDDWTIYHVNGGEVHCGSNEQRVPFAKDWWK